MYGLAATKTVIYDLTGAVSKSVQIIHFIYKVLINHSNRAYTIGVKILQQNSRLTVIIKYSIYQNSAHK